MAATNPIVIVGGGLAGALGKPPRLEAQPRFSPDVSAEVLRDPDRALEQLG